MTDQPRRWNQKKFKRLLFGDLPDFLYERFRPAPRGITNLFPELLSIAVKNHGGRESLERRCVQFRGYRFIRKIRLDKHEILTGVFREFLGMINFLIQLLTKPSPVAAGEVD